MPSDFQDDYAALSALVDAPALQRMNRPPSPPPKPVASIPMPPPRDPKRTSIFNIGRLRRSAPPAAANGPGNVQVSAIPLPNGSVVRAMDVFGEVMKQAAYLHGRASGETVEDQDAEGDELDWERIKTLPRVRLVPPEEDDSEPVLLYPPAPQRTSMPSFTAEEGDSMRLHATMPGASLVPFEPPSAQTASAAEPSAKRLSMSVAGGSACSSRGIWGGMSPGFSQPPPVFRRGGQRPGSAIVMPRKKEQANAENRPKAMPNEPFSPPRIRGSSIPVPSVKIPIHADAQVEAEDATCDDANVPLSVQTRRAMSDPPSGRSTASTTTNRAATFPPLDGIDNAHSFIELGDIDKPCPELPPSPPRESSPRRKSRAMSLTSILASKTAQMSEHRPPPVPPLPLPSNSLKGAEPHTEPDSNRLKKQKSLKNFFFAGSSGRSESTAGVLEGKRRKSNETESSSETSSASGPKTKRKDDAAGAREEGSLRKRFSLSNMSQAFKKRSLGPGSGVAVPKVPDLPAEYRTAEKASKPGKPKSKSVPGVFDAPVVSSREPAPTQHAATVSEVDVGGSARGPTPPLIVSSVGRMEFSPVVQSPTSIDPPLLPDLEMDLDSESDGSSLFSLEDVELGSASPPTQQQTRRATIMRVVPRYPMGFDLQEMMGMSTGSLPSHRIGDRDDLPDSPISMGPLLSRPTPVALDVNQPATATTSSTPDEDHCRTPDSDDWHSAESRPSSETDTSSSQPHTPLDNEAPTQVLLPAVPLPDVGSVDEPNKIVTETMLMSPSLSLTLRDPSEAAAHDLSPVSRVASTPKSRFSSPEGMLRMMASPRSNRSSFSGASVRTPLRNSTPPRLNDIPIPPMPDTREYSSLMNAVQLRSLKFDALGLDFEAFGGRKQAVEAV